MTEAAFILTICLLNPPLNVPFIIIVLANLTIAVSLLVGFMVKLCNMRIFRGSQHVLMTRLCLIAVVILFTQPGLAGHSYRVNQSGIMLAAPTKPASVVLAHADEHLLIAISKLIEK